VCIYVDWSTNGNQRIAAESGKNSLCMETTASRGPEDSACNAFASLMPQLGHDRRHKDSNSECPGCRHCPPL
jgi:hypothetical protein